MDTMPLRTMFVHSSNEMYGADKILVEILQALPERDRAGVVVHLPDDLPRQDGSLSTRLDSLRIRARASPLPVLRRRYLSAHGFLPLARRVWRTFGQFRELKPDVVYCTTSAMILCVPLARLAGVKRVVLHVQEIWSPKEAIVLGLIARFATQIYCISSASLQAITSGTVRGRASLLVNAHRDSGKDLLPVSATGPMKFVVASRWNSWKGHSTLLRAWDAAGSPGELVILGGPPPVGAAVEVRHLVENLQNPDSVKVVGEVADIEPYIDEADFLVLPSDRPEPFGLVILEAFARGRGVIASRGGGVVDIVEDGRNGRLYEIGSVEDLCDVFKSINRRQALEMGADARERYETIYSIAAYRSRFLTLWTATADSVDTRTNG